MDRKHFGKFIHVLRSQKRYAADDEWEINWTQERLAKETQQPPGSGKNGLSVKQIGDLERGSVKNIKPDVHLEPLVRAFGLNEAQAIEFYAMAGFVYPRETSGGRKHIERLIRKIQYPAAAKNILWDLVAFNAYHCELWGYTQETIDTLREGGLGANLLRLLFDPVFKDKREYFGPPDLWDRSQIQSIRSFRAMSFPKIVTKRYRLIMNTVRAYPAVRPYSSPEKLWILSEIDENAESSLGFGTIRVYHPDGKLEFMTLRFPYKVVGEDMDVSVYVPVQESEAGYRLLQDEVKKRGEQDKVHTFPEHPFD